MCIELYDSICGQMALKSGEALANTPFQCPAAPLQLARQAILSKALSKRAEFTHMWFIDDDVVPSRDCLAVLLAADKPIVSAVYMLAKRMEWADGSVRYIPSYGDFVERGGTYSSWDETSRIMEADWIGFGCVLLRLADLPGDAPTWFFPTDTLSEDVQFCRHSGLRGLRPWVATAARAHHKREVLLAPMAQAYTELSWSDEVLQTAGESVVTTGKRTLPGGYELVLRRASPRNRAISKDD